MGPLAGVKVLEMGGIGPAPYSSMILADMGADVMAIRRPGGDQTWAIEARFDLLNRGKRILEVNLADPQQHAMVMDLIGAADILLEGFRPGVMERLGLDPDTCIAANPKLVYCRITGWGQSGPLSRAAGHDLNYIALSGALGAIGSQAEPAIPLNLVGDFAGGSLFAVSGMLAALHHANRTGEGQVVDTAMIDGVAHMMAIFHAQRQAGQWQDRRGVNMLDGGAPFYNIYETADGRHVTLAAAEPQFYRDFIEKAGLAGEPLPHQYDRSQWTRLHERFTQLFKTRTQAEWCDVLEGSNACFAPVLGMAESIDHPHMAARGVFAHEEGVAQPVPAPRFSKSPDAPINPLPTSTLGLADALRTWGAGPS